jgi:hypothetical protein
LIEDLGEDFQPSFLCSSSTASASAATIAIAGAPDQALAARTCHSGNLRCTSDTHRLNTIESFFAGRDVVIDEFVREFELIQNLKLASHVFDSFKGRHFTGSFASKFDSMIRRGMNASPMEMVV